MDLSQAWVYVDKLIFVFGICFREPAGATSPVFVMALLLFVSGVPLLEASADKKWGDDPEYQVCCQPIGWTGTFRV